MSFHDLFKGPHTEVTAEGSELFVLHTVFDVVETVTDHVLASSIPTYEQADEFRNLCRLTARANGIPRGVAVVARPGDFVDFDDALQAAMDDGHLCEKCQMRATWVHPQNETQDLCRECSDEAASAATGVPIEQVKSSRDRLYGNPGEEGRCW